MKLLIVRRDCDPGSPKCVDAPVVPTVLVNTKPGMKVMELGSQVLVCHGEQQSVLNVLQAFGQQPGFGQRFADVDPFFHAVF